jgi:endonuclease YncB( thermonuclease family)
MELPPGYQVAGLLIAMPECPGAPAQPKRYRCVGVPDGDGLIVEHAGIEHELRLYGIDAPELDQPFGLDAKAWLASRVYGTDVHMLPLGTDQYNRTIAEVLDGHGRSVNHELCHLGLAWHYEQYAPHDSVLAFLHADAKAAHRGLWSDPTPIPPWVWRETH